MREWPKVIHRPLYVAMGVISSAGEWAMGDTERDLDERVEVVPADLTRELYEALAIWSGPLGNPGHDQGELYAARERAAAARARYEREVGK